MSGDTTSFAEQLRTFRNRAELTQEELAEHAGISPDAVGLLERGERRRPRADTVTRLAQALSLSATERAQFEAVARRPTPLGDPHQHAQLPAVFTTLVGRADAIERIAKRLQQPGTRLITLTGPGGVGKTRLALAVSERLSQACPDGVIFVPLAAVHTPDFVLETIATVLGIQERAGQSLSQRLIHTLQSRQALLVLDNFEHLLPAASLVSELLASCPLLRIVVTSRAPLHLAGEQQFAVSPLEVPATWQEMPLNHLLDLPAIALFQQRAQAVAPNFVVTQANGETVLAICRRLDGLPLAIELAAAWIKLLPPSILLQRLEHRLPLLVDGPRDLPKRQRTMRTTIAWSYDLLTAEEQALLRQLAVFAGGFTLAAVEAVGIAAHESTSTILPRLAALVDASLIQLDAWEESATPRYTVLETVREFAFDQLLLHQEEEAQRRHADYYVALAEQAESALIGADQANWLASLELEHANLRAALAWACTHSAALVGLRLAGALWRFWYMCGHLSEGRGWLRDALALPLVAEDDVRSGRAKALFGASGLAWSQGDLDEAVMLGEQSLLLRRELGDPVGVALVLNVLANVARDRGDYPQAITYLEEGLRLQRAAAHPFGIATALMNLGAIARDQGDYGRAVTLYEKSLALYRTLGNTSGIGIALNNLGDALLTAGEYRRATTLLEESVALARTINNPHNVASALDNLEIAVRYSGDYPRATVLAHESLAIRQRLNDKESIVTSLVNLGEIALEQGDTRQARTWLDQGLALAYEVGNLQWMALAQRDLGLVALHEERSIEAGEHFAESVRLYDSGAMTVGVAEALEGCAALAMVYDQAQCAVQLLGAAAALREQRGARPTPPERRLCEQTSAAARIHLNEAIYATAWAAGQALTRDEVVAEALAVTASYAADVPQ